WDLGGGTFDVSVLEMGEGIFEVRAVSGDTWLGGDDYDRRLMAYLALEYWTQHGVMIPPQDEVAWQRLKEAAEKAKIELSTALVTQVRLPCIGGNGTGAKCLEANLTREDFQALTADLVERMALPTRQALADAGLRTDDLDRVILVGGATRMPAVRAKARELLEKEPYRYIDPDEVVAMGAAIQAGVLMGMVDKVVLLDVIPLSLGIETQGGLFARVIPRNTPLPASEGRIFTTSADNQTSVDIHVLQGEREMILDNISLGQFTLDGIPPLPRGTPNIEVAFHVDVDGIVHVSASDLEGGVERDIKVMSSKVLHPEEMKQMVSDAASHADMDRKCRETVEAGITVDNLVSVAEHFWVRMPGPETNVAEEKMERVIARAREAKARGDIAEMRGISGELSELLRVSGNGVAA
ncbi:MAG: Hsp70 family protein, partial [Dehalococcoidia bacterium]|nr:Hsp70 family protein [Dehalococcoidia bacterium]